MEENKEKELTEVFIVQDPLEEYISKRITKMQLGSLRKSKHYTQKELSALTGLSVQCISDIESENSGNPTLRSLMKYLDILGYEMCFQRKRI